MLQRYYPANWAFDWDSGLNAGIAVLVALTLAYLAYQIIFGLATRLARLSETNVDELVVERIRRPVKWSILALGVTLMAGANPDLQAVWEPVAQFVRPALLGWIAYTLVKAFTATVEYRMEASDDPVAMRSRRTRLAVLSRTANFAIVFITVGLMLFSIPSVQSIGTTLLASAGLAALAVGAAAQPALKSLIGGLQIAVTEPFRIGDLVKIGPDAGRVEEIRMSFVTVRTWDERLLIVPTCRFIDESFENWSRANERLSGPVMLHLDPITDIAPIRAEFERYLGAHALFDGRTQSCLVTEAYPESVELRLAMSAPTIGELFELRCDVREHMLKWIRENQEDALIRHRLEVPNGHPKAGEP
ncbi:mechanosensitive ion channel family protein [Altererythrobacter sp. GH1-8]|uniref:mechanosensitive ion channel family protein n=1 Tax=Altererythrobacter sp. GH1-8 TaxID=3349333 RepID=UPI00374DF93C